MEEERYRSVSCDLSMANQMLLPESCLRRSEPGSWPLEAGFRGWAWARSSSRVVEALQS